MTYPTKDIYLASAFIAMGAELIDVDKTDPRHQIFILSGNHLNFHEYERSYANGKMVINLPDFVSALRRMKSTIHQF